ncbi:hypothetical protein K4K51_005327 [Colletotrichum sp. SAR 10_75]|nr:hypothetical protein K4K51_005327 [Colletotrichum sp. SAR 10_75]
MSSLQGIQLGVPSYAAGKELTLSLHIKITPQVIEAPSEITPHHAPLAAGMKIVIKIFDHDYYPHTVTFPRPFTHYQLADQDLSRQASALRYMHRVGRDENGIEIPGKLRLTGGHNLTPEYYGTWVIDLNRISADGKRYAGAVAMEYIDGVSMEDLCTREDEDSMRVYPMAEPQPLYDADDENDTHGYLDMGEHTRLKVLADIIGGYEATIAAEDVVKKRLSPEERSISARRLKLSMTAAEERLNRPEVEADIKSELDELVKDEEVKDDEVKDEEVKDDKAEDDEAKDDKAGDNTEAKDDKTKNDEAKDDKAKPASKSKASPYVPNYLKSTTSSRARSKSDVK